MVGWLVGLHMATECWSNSLRTVYYQPIDEHSSKKQLDNFNVLLLAKAKFGKHLTEKSSAELYQLLSFKYFMKLFFIPTLLAKVS